MLTAETLTRAAPDIEGAAERIRQAQGILDVIFSLAAYDKYGSIEGLRPASLPDVLAVAQDLLEGAQDRLTGTPRTAGEGAPE